MLPSPLPYCERLVGFLVPIDDHVGDLLHLGVPDPLADGVISLVDLDPIVAEALLQGLRLLTVVFANRDDPDLDGREPERKSTGVMLDEDPGEALE